MRVIRKLTMVAVCGLAISAFLAASAGAVTVRVGSATGTIVPVGTSIDGATTTGSPATLTGVFFGVSATVTCDSSVGGAVLANPSAGGKAWGTTQTLTFTNCHNAFGPCTVTVTNLPWTPNTTDGNGGGLAATSTTSVDIGTGTNGMIDVSNCVGRSAGSCELQGTLTNNVDGSFELTNYVTATWTNGAAEQLAINTTNIKVVNTTTCSLTSPKWTASYHVTRTSDGAAIFLGA